VTQFLRGVVAAALLMLLTAVPAFAHAELEESDPADGETITTPYTLTTTFNEEIGTERSRIVVTNSAGEEVARGGISADDSAVMTVDLPALEPGAYLASWTAVTPDDNGVTRGQVNFVVGENATPTPVPTTRPTASARPSVVPSTVASLAPSPLPTPTSGGTPTASGNDILLALALAAVVLLGLGIYLFTRRR
jgi:methionine-rich copper-binding protein CopC